MESGKKLLIVTPIYPPEIGGPASYIPELINHLPKNITTHVITFSKPSVSTPKIKAESSSEVVKIPLSGNFIFRQLRLALQLIKLVPQFETVYAQGTLTVGLTSVVFAKLFGKKSLIKFVGDEVWESTRSKTLEEFYKSKPASISLLLHRLVLKLVDTIVVPSDYLKEFLIRYHQVNSKKITVIPNAFELPKEITEFSKDQDPGTNHLIFVGRLVPWKNVDQIIEAVKIANQKQPIHLTIVGDGPEQIRLVGAIRESPLHPHITFTGQLSKTDTLKLITKHQGLILYSSYEGHPHVILEAHALGVPTIASNIPPHKNLGCFALVEPNNPKALAEEIIKLINIKNLPSPPKPPSWESHVIELAKYV